MRAVLAGASGRLGRALCQHLDAAGHDVVRLVRRDAGVGESRWDPYAGVVDRDLIGSADVVVNLAGSPTAGNPHSKRWARELLESRVQTTTVLAEAVAAAHRNGSTPAFLAGNGISYYGDQGDRVLTEEAGSTGDALLTEVTRQWQAATRPAARAGARVAILRTAPVMHHDTAPLKPLRLATWLGLGTRIGDGRQYFPMISLRDWVGAVTHLAGTDVEGPVNLCCPTTPTNGEFTRALADALHRPAFLVAPAPIVRVAAGAMAPEVLGSVRAEPAVLLASGYEFHDLDVHDVLAAGLRPS